MTPDTAVAAFDSAVLDRLWDDVPPEFRVWSYEPDSPAFAIYRGRRGHPVALPVEPLSESVRRELAWWVWSCYASSNRHVPFEVIRHLVAVITEIDRRRRGGELTRSLTEPAPELLIRTFRRLFYERYQRFPGEKLNREFRDEVRFIRFAFDRRYSQLEWWRHDIWSPRQDPRIPIRAHEPLGEATISFGKIASEWVREALKYYAANALETGELTWGTLGGRVHHVGNYFGNFVAERDLPPTLCASPEDELRPLMLDYLSFLRAHRKTWKGERKPLSPLTIRNAQVGLRGFYGFLVEHRRDVASVLDDRRFLELSGAHLWLWRRSDVGPERRRSVGSPPEMYIEDADLAAMIDHIDLLGMSKTETKTFLRDGATVTVHGIDDPSAMRAWLIQALTGRRANEILMLDFAPLQPVPGLATADDGEMVARLRYQQTKIPGAPNTILVGGDVVALATEQQAWVRERFKLTTTDPDPPYLFPSLNRNPRGTRHRSLSGYHNALTWLTEAVQLVDRGGRLLVYSKSHRLRHTKATTLLNLGAPLHVVMRYMGHHSEAMVLHYAQTLAETAEREFLRTRKIGADGRALELSPRDIFDMISLGDRTDRVLPTGVCLLPPVKHCEKGNACYSCGYFATDATFLDEHRQLLEQSLTLVERRKELHFQRTGREMSDDNVWLREQLATIAALRLIIRTLEHEPEAAIQGAGSPRGPGEDVPVSIDTTGNSVERFRDSR